MLPTSEEVWGSTRIILLPEKEGIFRNVNVELRSNDKLAAGTERAVCQVQVRTRYEGLNMSSFEL